MFGRATPLQYYNKVEQRIKTMKGIIRATHSSFCGHDD